MAVAITMNGEQFEHVLGLLVDGKVEGVTVSDVNGENGTGHIHTDQIDADYRYMPMSGTLVFEHEEKHGLTKMISDETIGQHLSKLLSSLPAADAPVEEASEVKAEEPAASTFVKPVEEKAGS